MRQARVRSKNQITIPQEIAQAMGISEGDYLTFKLRHSKDGSLKTVEIAPGEVAVKPWTDEEWREKEREADEDIKAGRVSGPFDSAEELIAHLRKASKKWRRKS